VPLPFDIDIAMIFPDWDKTGLHISALCARALPAIIEQLTTPRLGELSIALMDDAGIQTLNRTYRQSDKPTNVLSFPAPAPLLGDIVLALETCQNEAADKRITLEAHVTHLLIHGFLHLQGYDHITENEALTMESLEITALAQLGIDNPYEIREP